jgi:predicted dehydrogenase
MQSRSIDRRTFLKAFPLSATAAAIALHGKYALATAARRRAANERIAIGVIGCGDLATNWHIPSLVGSEDFDVVALCDVDRRHLDAAVALTDGKASAHSDHRELLDRAEVDAVMIVTPDHWHALNAIDACRAGKDVYCEKPLSLTIAEGRAMSDAARRYGRVFQVGTQQRSSHDFHWAVDLVRNGRLGKLQRIRAVIGRGPVAAWEPNLAPPQELDWDRWLGPAPSRPYTPKRCHYSFRWFKDYSGGKLTDWGAHHLDIAQWALGADQDSGPTRVEGRATFPANSLYDTASTFEIEFGYGNGVVLECSSEGENGVTFEGSEGSLFVSRERIAADPIEILDQEPGCGDVRLYESRDHRKDFANRVRDRGRPISDVETGHRSATLCHMANIALDLRRPLRFDPKTERFDDEDANRLLSRPMRAGYSL